QQAVRLDPKYALAYAEMADAYFSLGISGAVRPKEMILKAKEVIAQALKLDDQLAEAYTALGEVKAFYDWDRAGAEKAHQRALELNPNSVVAHQLYSIFLLYSSGRFDAALAENERALALDPLSVVLNRNEGMILYYAGQYDRAIEQLQKTLDLDPNFPSV